MVQWSLIPTYQVENVRKGRFQMANRASQAGMDPVAIGLVDGPEVEVRCTCDGGVAVDEAKSGDWKAVEEEEAPDFWFTGIPAVVWKEGRVPMSLATCKDKDICLLCILCRNTDSCRFACRGVSWFYQAYQAMIILVIETPVLLEMVKASQQSKVLQAIECAVYLKTALEIPVGQLYPRYLRLRAVNLLEQHKNELQVTEVKRLFNVAMITLDVQAHQTELKQEQTAFLNAADSGEAEQVRAKLSWRAEYPTLSRTAENATEIR